MEMSNKSLALIAVVAVVAIAGAVMALGFLESGSDDARVTLDRHSLSMEAGETGTIAATVVPSGAVAWTSSDPSVATVSSGGVVAAVSAGTATVTATFGSSEASCIVTVSSPSSGTDSIAGLTVSCVSGTSGITSYDYSQTTGEYTVTFGTIKADTEYSMSGNLNGNIVIDVDPTGTYDFTLDLSGLNVSSSVSNPILVLSGDNVDISATKGTANTVTDSRPAVDSDEEGVYSAAIYSTVDLKLKGKGALTVTSANNNGIHSKDDLEVKNLTLTVTCLDNALKGNDGVEITSGTVTLYAKQGDGIKTSNSATKSGSDGSVKQQGVVAINSDDGDTVLTIYAACDGIDAAYDVQIDETENNTVTLKVFTGAYYSGAEAVTSTDGDTMYLKVPSSLYGSGYTYYAQFSDGSSTSWVKATYLKSASDFRSTYHYFTLDRPSSATKVAVFIYSGTPSSEAASGYRYCSSAATLNTSRDMIVLSSYGSSNMGVSFGSYTVQTPGGGMWGGGGMMQEGNANKTSYSAKGIKAANAVSITGGTISVSAGDDAIHANHDSAIEATTRDSYGFGKGDVTISGGTLTLISNDDGIHADGTLTISGGSVTVSKSYEGLEGGSIAISGGSMRIISSDDGINGTATSNEDRGSMTQVYGYVRISGGYVYMIAGGDGIDSNCTSQGGLAISGGKIVVISTSGGNSAIDTDARYVYSGGYLFAACPQGMTQEMTNLTGGTYKAATGSLSTSTYVTVQFGSETLVVKMPVSISNAYLFALWSSSPTISASGSSDASLDGNGVYWSS